MTEQKTISISPIDRLDERLTLLEADVQLLKMLARQGTAEAQESVHQATKKVIQINANGRKYFCASRQEQGAFKLNNPGVATEVHEVELLATTADEYLNDPENKKQFTRKELVRS